MRRLITVKIAQKSSIEFFSAFHFKRSLQRNDTSFEILIIKMEEPAETETKNAVLDVKIEQKSTKNPKIVTIDKNKPFRHRRYFLHVKTSEEEELCRRVRKLGGSVVAVLEKVYAVVTDDPCFVKYVLEKRQSSAPNSATNGGGSSFFVQRSSGAADSSSNLQQLTSKERLNNYFKKMPSVLRQAYDLHLKILTLNQFRAQLAELEANLKSHSKFKSPQISSSVLKKNGAKNTAPVRLQAPFLKFEDKMQVFCPIFKEFNKEPWPRIVIKPNGRGCPFERKFNDDDQEKVPKKETEAKPRLTTPKRNALGGFCELCQSWAENVEMHVKGPSHRKNACSDSKYADFDALVSQGPTLDDFLSSICRCDDSKTEENLVQSECETEVLSQEA